MAGSQGSLEGSHSRLPEWVPMGVKLNYTKKKNERSKVFSLPSHTTCSDTTRFHVPISGKPSPKVIPGWDTDMTAARNSSMFWHDIWVSCNKPESGWVYAIMRKNRNVYHYKLRGLKKLRQSKIKLSVSRSMMTSKNRNYWKSARAVRKILYNNTPVFC